jgi:hypothetical protein
VLFPFAVVAQSTTLPIHAAAAQLTDRYDVLHPGHTPLHTAIQGYHRQDVAWLAAHVDSLTTNPGRLETFDLQYLINENAIWAPDSSRLQPQSRRGILGVLYRTPGSFFSLKKRHFALTVQPMLQLQVGKGASENNLTFQNQRGLEIQGSVDQKVFFYSNLVETQARFPDYFTTWVQRNRAIPGAGFYKNFKGSLWSFPNSYDYMLATAYAGVQISRHVGVQLGHGQHFIGHGIRSMLWSDMSPPAFFLKFDTRVWRLHYQNLFVELSPVSQVDIPDGTILPKKYAAMHYLSYKVSPRLTFGLFEATVLHRSRQFEFQYLNPVIFYRTVEGMIGSPDNVLLGMNAQWIPRKGIQVYGQFLLDELRVSEFLSTRGWWANKHGVQLGFKYHNAGGIDHLDVQLEYNSARPYTYAHGDPYDSYTHYNQPLAHPLGANFREIMAVVRYRPASRWWLTLRGMYARQGENSATENWGTDPLLTYNNRVREYGNRTTQGIGATFGWCSMDVSWMLQHNLYLDLKALWRRKDSVEEPRNQRTRWAGVGLRWNMWPATLPF